MSIPHVAEDVLPGHPDRLADAIAEYIVDLAVVHLQDEVDKSDCGLTVSCPLTLTPKDSGKIVPSLMNRFGATTRYQSV